MLSYCITILLFVTTPFLNFQQFGRCHRGWLQQYRKDELIVTLLKDLRNLSSLAVDLTNKLPKGQTVNRAARLMQKISPANGIENVPAQANGNQMLADLFNNSYRVR